MKIPIAKTSFTDEDFNGVRKVLESGWVVQGPRVKEFEDFWNLFTGSKNSVAVTSCTTALHLALIAAGIKAGDEVLVPAFTWVATANAVEYTGAIPVFCDVDLNTFNIDVTKIESRITKKTKAIIPVHLFGLAVEMDSVTAIAKKHNIKVIEDAACGFGTYYKEVHVGNFGDFGCFSFHPRKAITTGEGGMITTNNSAAAETLRSLRDHGASVSDLQRHEGNKPYLLPEFPHLGYNYRMTDIQASLGVSQMERAHAIYNRRNEIAKTLSDGLKEIEWLKLPTFGKDFKHGYQSYVCMFAPEEIKQSNVVEINSHRNKFMDYLLANGISTRPGTHAVHNLEYYAKKYSLKPTDFLNSYIADQCSISLPVFPGLKEEEIHYIIEKIQKYEIIS
jgi:dTDP-4-amino-4,6-dideoxygalactose transaminase